MRILAYKVRDEMNDSFIVYLKNQRTHEFEYANNVVDVQSTQIGYRITFNNGRSYNYGADRVQYYPRLLTRDDVRIYERGVLNELFNKVDDYGRCFIFRNADYHSYPIEISDDIEICEVKKDTKKANSVLDYFKDVLGKSGRLSFDISAEEEESKFPNQISSEILLRALERIDVKESRSVFSHYMDGTKPPVRKTKAGLIYPFGCNESQKLAVETALSDSLTIIEGPPGTGKTQTILNIIANLIVQNKVIAVVSNNNSAILNVREKLDRYGYGVVVATLGNNKNKASFFDHLDKQFIQSDFAMSKEQLSAARYEIQRLETILTKCFQDRNKLATLKVELSDARVEFNHLKAEQSLDPHIKSLLDKKFYRKWSFNKTLKLKYLQSFIDFSSKLSLTNKLLFMVQYGFFDFNCLSEYSEEFPIYVNYKFYELYLSKLESEIATLEDWLSSNDEEENLAHFIEVSKKIFNATLFQRYNRLDNMQFDIDSYRSLFSDFTKRYPVILSSTLSLHTSIPRGYLFDYLIIDESSQVDIIKSAVCFSCCRNAVVVGDSMQLTHIVDKHNQEAADQFQKEYNISPAYDYVKNNILNSLKSLYGKNIRSVLLKEHYRCHPTIIGFCNKKYYNNNLVVMTHGDNHPFRIIETNISGGRGNYNQRQIDETDLYIREKYASDYTQVGVVAPYRDHANMLQKQLPDGVEADTIHKFQGREKDVIVFNTVRNKIEPFIDNPNLINVAVSRAVKEFIVVKPASMKLTHGTNIGDMIRYMCYTTDTGETILKGSICSVFDLLYKEYDKAFTSFMSSNKKIKGSAAEIIIYRLLKDDILLNSPQFSSVDMVREYRLRDLIRDRDLFSEEENRFISSNSRIDFLLYNKLDKSPILAIEVDGVSFHDNEVQRERDRKKDHILEVIGLPLLRLSTDGYDEEARIIQSLNNTMQCGES